MTLVDSREVEITNVLGLHLRAAERFVRMARTFVAKIEVFLNGKTADGKSVLDLACLAAPPGSRLRLEASGPDALEALSALEALVLAGFFESPEQPLNH